MAYHIYHAQEKKVPGIAVVLTVLLLVAGLVVLFSGRQKPVIKTDSSVRPVRVDTANVRDRSLTVFWRTDKPTTGYVVYTVDDDVSLTAYDERDTADNLNSRHNHVVQLTHLRPDTDVYYNLIIDGKAVGQTTSTPFIVRTTRIITQPADVDPVYGEVIRMNGVVERNAVALLKIGQSLPLLSMTQSDGSFLFSMCCVFHAQRREPIIPSDEDQIRLELIAEDGTVKTIEGFYADVAPLSEPIAINSSLNELADASQDEEIAEVLSVSDSIEALNPVDIIYPREDAAIPGLRPLVRGVGEPGAQVKGRFTPAGRIFQVDVDEKRNWLYQPSFDFQPGQHELSVETQDTSGRIITLSRTFTILKSGEAVLQAATGEATLTPTEIPTPTEVLDTEEPEVTSVETPTPPVSGINILPFTVLSLALVVIGAGIILLF